MSENSTLPPFLKWGTYRGIEENPDTINVEIIDPEPFSTQYDWNVLAKVDMMDMNIPLKAKSTNKILYRSYNRLLKENKIKVGTILKLNIKQNTLDNIGAFTTVTKKLKLNGDRGRMWWGKLSDVRLKERNISTPFDLSMDDPTKI